MYATLSGDAPAHEAWSAFWQEPRQTMCLAGARDVQRELAAVWRDFAAALAPHARVLDLGCGAGAVARALIAARQDLYVTGVDFAAIPRLRGAALDLTPRIAMEDLPFANASFDAAVSQFGFEYSDCARSARELVRVLKPKAAFTLLVHHAASSIVAANSARARALDGALGVRMRTAFLAGDAIALRGHFATLIGGVQHDVVSMLANALPAHLQRSQRERTAIWKSIEEALAPERCILRALQTACVAPGDLQRWLEPLRRQCIISPVWVVREGNGKPIAWRIQGANR